MPSPSCKLHLVTFSPDLDIGHRFLHQDEKRRHTRPQARRQFLASRLFAKQLYFPAQSERWANLLMRYVPEYNGTCLIEAGKVLHRFSLSHGGNWLALTDMAHGPVGLDVQPHDRRPESLKRLIANLPEADVRLCRIEPTCFYDLWVTKEAFAKLAGRSIMEVFSLPARRIQQLCHVRHIQLRQASLALAWQNLPAGLQVCFWHLTPKGVEMMNERQFDLR